MAEAALARLKTLSTGQQRRAAAVLGALVADAATAPLHWIYDQPKVKALTEEKGVIEFYPTSQNPFYTIETGLFCPYGDQLFLTLKTLAECKGFDEVKQADAIFKTFGPNTIYEEARKQSSHPIKGPWTNKSVKIFLANREEGDKPEADPGSKDPDGLIKSIAVIALLYGKPELFEAVLKNLNITQSHPVAIGYAVGGVKILESIIRDGQDGLNGAIRRLRDPKRACPLDTDEEVASNIENAMSHAGKTHSEATKEFGLACGMPPSFKGMIHGIATSRDFQSAVRRGILAAGDNCSRGLFIGAAVAARYGLDSIPLDWVQKVKRADEILGYIETIVQ